MIRIRILSFTSTGTEYLYPRQSVGSAAHYAIPHVVSIISEGEAIWDLDICELFMHDARLRRLIVHMDPSLPKKDKLNIIS